MTKVVTMCGWFKPESFSTWHGLIGKAKYYYAERQGVGIAANSSGNLYVQWGGTSGGFDLDTTITLSVGTWYHVSVVADGVNRTARVIVYNADTDTTAIKDFTSSNISTQMVVGSDDFRIGNFVDVNNQTFDGKIDEVVVFSRLLSDSEIASIISGTFTYTAPITSAAVTQQYLEVAVQPSSPPNAVVTQQYIEVGYVDGVFNFCFNFTRKYPYIIFFFCNF